MTSLAIMARSRMRDERPLQQPAKKYHNVLVSRQPRQPTKGLLRLGPLTFACALGRGGIGVLKREGDGKTPLAAMEVLYGFYRKDRWPMINRHQWMLPSHTQLGWCDTPGNRNYNRAVKRPYAASHEKLARDDGLYDCVIVLNWNMKPRKRNCGSAIFLHIARPNYQPTEGCIAVSKRDMMRLLGLLKPSMIMRTLI